MKKCFLLKKLTCFTSAMEKKMVSAEGQRRQFNSQSTLRFYLKKLYRVNKTYDNQNMKT